MNITWKFYDLKLKDAFGISRGTRTVVPSVIISIGDGRSVGYGEATVNPYYGTSIASFDTELKGVQGELEAFGSGTPEEFDVLLDQCLGEQMFLKCALGQAFLDCYCRSHGMTSREFFNYPTRRNLISSYTIGLDTVPEMIRKVRQTPWPIYKIKLGAGYEKDLEILSALRKETSAIFRIDVNGGWSLEQALRAQNHLKDLGVEFIEQPLHADAREDMKRLYEQALLPMIADESCLIFDDIVGCHGYFHGVNIKLMKCGGMLAADRMIQKAKSLDMQVMMGCMTESSIGISAIAQFVSELDYVDMDGAMLLKNDPAYGVEVKKSAVVFPQTLGNGGGLF
ncbi:MAG: dipeptide epimerase [Flavobacteriaceae bacterium]